MKSKKGVTMMSLILYVASFLIVTTVVATITTFFYNNVVILDTKTSSNSQYNRINLYFLNQCKKNNVSLFAWKNIDIEANIDTPSNISALKNNPEGAFITFKEENNIKNSFIYVEDEKNLYFNSVKIGQDIEEFKFKIDYSFGKPVLKVFINIDGTSFTTEYVVAL
ncbi:MAG: hypothetical protein IKM97_00155 [Clostridia bacterium]|nr:hypothetical protein [Clostridia bacterium]